MEVMNKTDGTFTDEDVEVFSIFANLCAAAIHNAQAYRRIRLENIAYRRETLPPVEVIAHGKAMRQVLVQAKRAAAGDAAVLIRGEAGTGKEVVARFIHQHSTRAARPMVSVNCAALGAQELRNELFGYEAGAFPGARERRLGRLELADGGVLFLDEITSVDADAQARLLRVMVENRFERVGGRDMVRADVRLIAAQSREGAVDPVLFSRLGSTTIVIPPLRERPGDVEPLVRYFAMHISAELKIPAPYIGREVIDLLKAYPWPGNVRELQIVLERALTLSQGRPLGPDDLPVEVCEASTS
jgi:DNA-binding NtrC family response regulator